MRFRIPGRDMHVRFFEPVEAKQDGYHLTEVGVEYPCGGVDSVVTGVSAHSLKSWFGPADAAKATVTVKPKAKTKSSK